MMVVVIGTLIIKREQSSYLSSNDDENRREKTDTRLEKRWRKYVIVYEKKIEKDLRYVKGVV